MKPLSVPPSDVTIGPSSQLTAILARQEKELKYLTTMYVALESKYYGLIDNSNYESMKPEEKTSYTTKKNRLETERNEIALRVAAAENRVRRTKRLMDHSTGSIQISKARVPNIPKFRGNHKDNVYDAYEYIEQCKALFVAHQLPQNRWLNAILTGLSSVDRNWANENLRDLTWSDITKNFVGHFESPILRDKLLRDFMNIKLNKSETVQHYCDRFTNLMRRTSKRDNDPALVSVFISGLDTKLQEMHCVARATSLAVWNRNNSEEFKESIAWEVQNAIGLDEARQDGSRV